MKYQIGDTVLLLHSNEEGTVLDIIGDNMLTVDVGGVQFPVYTDQVDFPYFKRFSEKKIVPQVKEKKYIDDIRAEKPYREKNEDGVWLSFLPVMDVDEFGDEVVSSLKLFLLNHNGAGYRFVYKLHYFGKPDFELKNNILPFQDFYLHDIAFSDLNDSPSFEFDFSLEIPDKKMEDHVESIVKLKPRQLFEKIDQLLEKNEASFSHRLFLKYPGKTREQDSGNRDKGAWGKLGLQSSDSRQVTEPVRSVIDLHIDKLTDQWEQLSPYEILHTQLSHFEKYYDLALQHNLPSLIVIHGVGAGRLRDEIHDLLRYKKEVKTFVNQFHPSFGFGATEILFQYS